MRNRIRRCESVEEWLRRYAPEIRNDEDANLRTEKLIRNALGGHKAITIRDKE